MGLVILIKNYNYIIFVGFTNALAFMCLGSSLSWASPSIAKLLRNDSYIPVTNSEASTVGSILAIGAVSVAIPFMLLFKKFGRKTIIIVLALLYISGWIALILARNVYHLYIGRFLLGTAVGPTYGIIPVYLAEVVDKSSRGAIVALLIVSQSIGALMQYAIGPILSIQTHNTVSIITPIIFFICTLMIPETPYYLIGNNQENQARKVLIKLRSTDNIDDELCDIKLCLNESPPMTYKELLKELRLSKTRKIFAIITIATLLQQFSGTGAIVVYMETIFTNMNSPIPPKYAVILSEVLFDCTLLFALILTDRFGRKPLLLYASIVCSTAEILVGIFFYLRESNLIGDDKSWIGVCGIFLIQIGYGMGLASVPILIMSEVMSFNLKGWFSGYYQLVQGFYNASCIKLFQILTDDVGSYFGYWFFAGFIVASVIYLMLNVPETKNKTLQEIQDLLVKTDNPETIGDEDL